MTRLAWFVGLALLICIVIGRLAHPEKPPSVASKTCFITGGGTLRVCHAALDEGVYNQPSRQQLAYNTQIIALGGGKYAAVLHSEAQDMVRYAAATGQMRPGDSIKTGLGDSAFNAPADLDYRIWGSMTNPASPLYYAFDPQKNKTALGLSGGGNPMVVRGLAARGDPYFYIFFLGVTSDAGRGVRWRNALLEARSKDFINFDLLQDDASGKPVWVKFAGDAAMPAIVRDSAGKNLVSNQPALVETGQSKQRVRPKGAVVTAGLFGTVIHAGTLYYYFYGDEDAVTPARNHLYVRTTADVTSNGRWSPPRIVMDLPPEIIVRVSKAPGMDRWAILYMCLRSVRPFVSDLCLQYSSNLNLSGPGSLGSLKLFNGPVYNGLSDDALGLIGGDKSYDSGEFLKIQPYYLSGEDGNFAIPPRRPGQHGNMAGLVTWNDLPLNIKIFGARTYWGEWTVSPAN